MIFKGESREETLVWASCRNAVQFILAIAIMLLTKVDRVGRFHRTFLQVPYLKVLALIYGKELTYTCCESVLVVNDYRFLVLTRRLSIIEV